MLDWIAQTTRAKSVTKRERIQSLWSGYGEIFRVDIEGSELPITRAIVKWVTPPAITSGKKIDAGHARKCRSYDVENVWYREFAARCDDTCRIAKLLGSKVAKDEWIFVLEDLDDVGFGKRRRDPNAQEMDACLRWLASFHARFLGTAPKGLWKLGTYWHLATRGEELSLIEDDALREAAPLLDRKLREAVFQTLVHGDAKPANFCFASHGSGVAVVDFQYVGGGCGMKDVAYLISGAEPAEETRYLDAYFRYLRVAANVHAVDIDALEAEWRMLYPIACADYYRFIAGWAPDHWRRDRTGQRVTRDVLRTLTA